MIGLRQKAADDKMASSFRSPPLGGEDLSALSGVREGGRQGEMPGVETHRDSFQNVLVSAVWL